MKVLVLGANGMIGGAVFSVLSENISWQVFGTLRQETTKQFFPDPLATKLLKVGNLEHFGELVRIFSMIKPGVVVNCVGLTKHLPGAENPLFAIPINALLPHRLLDLCTVAGARLIQVSTDCIFSGKNGNYLEDDLADATDIYGRSKFLGEVNHTNGVTLRTSTIGHEFQSAYGLLEWFLSQGESCKGFSRAIFSGLPSVVFGQIIRDIVIPNPDISGVYNVVGPAIGKYELLQLIAKTYKKKINIVRDEDYVIDRSLNGERFRFATGYEAPSWPELIQIMYEYHSKQGSID